MPTLPAESVDLILTDLPYRSLSYEWDSVIPLSDLWREFRRITKPLGTFITTSSNPFSAFLINSNLEQFKYSYAWKKSLGTNFMHSKNAPIKVHEDILVFSKGSINHPTVSNTRMTYNPQLVKGNAYIKKQNPRVHLKWNNQQRPSTNQEWISKNDGFRYPTSFVEFSNGNNHNDGHPTQKPVSLYEWLVNTYTNPGETVLDICMGSGTTGVACIQTGRKFIGIEKDTAYFAIAERRISEAQPSLFNHAAVQPPLAPDAATPRQSALGLLAEEPLGEPSKLHPPRG